MELNVVLVTDIKTGIFKFLLYFTIKPNFNFGIMLFWRRFVKYVSFWSKNEELSEFVFRDYKKVRNSDKHHSWEKSRKTPIVKYRLKNTSLEIHCLIFVKHTLFLLYYTCQVYVEVTRRYIQFLKLTYIFWFTSSLLVRVTF